MIMNKVILFILVDIIASIYNMQNSLPPPVVAMHPPSTIRSSIGRRLHAYSHLSPPQYTTPTHHTMQPIGLSTRTNHTHTPTTPTTQPIHPKPPHHGTIQTNHLISPLPLCTHSRRILFYLAFP
jgi:hypothetical protein